MHDDEDLNAEERTKRADGSICPVIPSCVNVRGAVFGWFPVCGCCYHTEEPIAGRNYSLLTLEIICL